MEIRATGTWNLDAMKALTHVSMFGTADPKKRMMFWTIAYALLFAIVVGELLLFGANGILFALMGVILVYLPFLWCWYSLLPRIKFRALAKMQNITHVFTFRDEEMEMVAKHSEYSAEATIKYTLLVRVAETSRYFFLFPGRSQAYIVDKHTITGGTAEEIRNKLSSCLGNRYLVCRY